MGFFEGFIVDGPVPDEPALFERGMFKMMFFGHDNFSADLACLFADMAERKTACRVIDGIIGNDYLFGAGFVAEPYDFGDELRVCSGSETR